jgi:hypothetical protein
MTKSMFTLPDTAPLKYYRHVKTIN